MNHFLKALSKQGVIIDDDNAFRLRQIASRVLVRGTQLAPSLLGFFGFLSGNIQTNFLYRNLSLLSHRIPFVRFSLFVIAAPRLSRWENLDCERRAPLPLSRGFQRLPFCFPSDL